MRISDWSSDVCSSDLPINEPEGVLAPTDNFSMRRRGKGGQPLVNAAGVPDAIAFTAPRETQVIVDYKRGDGVDADADSEDGDGAAPPSRSEEHTSELQSLMRISYAVFCLKKKT